MKNSFKEVNIRGKVNIKQKLLKIACPVMNSMVPPFHKVKTKGSKRSKVNETKSSTKRESSYFEHVDALYSIDETSSWKTQVQYKTKFVQQRRVLMLDQFYPIFHSYIVNVIDVVANGHCGYRCIAASLGLSEDSWTVI